MGNYKSVWKSHWTHNEKPWGSEEMWFCMQSGFHGKILHIKKGERTSFKYHNLKDEVLMFLKGSADITYGNEKYSDDPVNYPILTEKYSVGDSLNVQSGCPYRIHALEDCTIIEIGNNNSDEPVRIEDDYGRVKHES